MDGRAGRKTKRRPDRPGVEQLTEGTGPADADSAAAAGTGHHINADCRAEDRVRIVAAMPQKLRRLKAMQPSSS